MSILAFAVIALGLTIIGAIVRKVIRGDSGTDQALYRTTEGRKLVPPRSPSRRKRGF
jgi:hypothetical protein